MPDPVVVATAGAVAGGADSVGAAGAALDLGNLNANDLFEAVGAELGALAGAEVVEAGGVLAALGLAAPDVVLRPVHVKHFTYWLMTCQVLYTSAMARTDKLWQELAALGERRKAAREELRATSKEIPTVARKAVKAGIQKTEVARLANVSRPALDDMLNS